LRCPRGAIISGVNRSWTVIPTSLPPAAPTAVIEALPLEAGRRLIVAHDPVRCRQARRQRAQRLKPVLKLAAQLARRLAAQDSAQPLCGRRLTDAGAKLTLAHAIKDARASRWLQIDPDNPLFVWGWDIPALKRDLAFDGKLILLTNIADLTPAALVSRYKELADIERGFRILKSQLDIAPIHHRLPARIRAHTLLCFLAWVLQRLLRDRLRRSHNDLSPAKALERLKAIQYHRVQLANGRWLSNVSCLSLPVRNLL
jgi:IS4 transposase